MIVLGAAQNSAQPQPPPTRYQRRSPAERSFALNGSPEQPEFRESPLQTLPRDLLRAHVFEAVSLWDLGRLGCAASWLAETVFDDQKAWERRNGLLVGGLQCMHGGVLGATRAGRVAERCWTAILTAATEAPRPTTRTPYCVASWVAVNVEARRRAEAAAVAARHGAPCALPPQGGRARAASIDAEASLDGFLEDAYALAALATPSELTQLIAEAGASPASEFRASPPTPSTRYLLHAGGTARAVSLVATFLRVVDGHQLGLGTGIDSLAPVARDMNLRNALRAAAAADNGYDYRCVVWDLGGLQLYRLRDAVRSSESGPRCVASGALFFLERDTFVPARHVMQSAAAGLLEQIHHQNQLKVAAASAGRFVGFLEDNFGRTLPAGVRKPVFQVRVTT